MRHEDRQHPKECETCTDAVLWGRDKPPAHDPSPPEWALLRESGACPICGVVTEPDGTRRHGRHA